MGSQLDHLVPGFHGPFDGLYYPLINAGTVPYAYQIDTRRTKRPRFEPDSLSQINTAAASSVHHGGILSARSVSGISFTAVSSNGTGPDLHDRPASTPPRSRPGKKKKCKQVIHNGPFIQETFEFPKRQTWLKPRPRQRKKAVEAVEEIEQPSSEAPDEGQALSLDRHADRIAALIAQKRKDNDSKLFRERMALQQRLHRGEPDVKDRLIAASHDELKRKMELSAQGIFEHTPPDGKESVPAAEDGGSSAVSLVEQHSLQEPAADDQSPVEEAITVETSSSDDSSSGAEMEEVRDTENSDVHEIHREEPVVPAQSHPAQHQPTIGPCFHTQTQAILTQHTFIVPSHSPCPQPTASYLAQLRVENRVHATHNWQTESDMTQQWASQMWHALPSAQPVVQSMHTPQPEAASMYNIQPGQYQAQHQAASYHNNMTSSILDGSMLEGPTSGTIFAHSACASNISPQPCQVQDHLAVPQSNMNMFTRQVRENGVIGGNNNYSEPAGERRRNMFASRA